MRSLFAALLLLALPARAEDAVLRGTLKTIKDRGSILIGVRDSAIPFSFQNRGRQPVGFSVDLCMGIAADVAAALNMNMPDGASPGLAFLRTMFVPVTAEARLPKLVSGEIDLECGSTTANAERAKTVAFSPVFFLAGTKLMTAAAGGVASYHDLGGKAVAVSAGTTNADVMRTLAKRGNPAFTVVDAPDLPAAMALLSQGKAAAFASDDILLAGMLATTPGPRSYRIVGDYLSYEPYAIAFRRDDPDFAALVDASFRRMAAEGTLRALYNRWFTGKLPNGERLNLPMSSHLAEMFRALGEPD